jgi:hypothetical protein
MKYLCTVFLQKPASGSGYRKRGIRRTDNGSCKDQYGTISRLMKAINCLPNKITITAKMHSQITERTSRLVIKKIEGYLIKGKQKLPIISGTPTLF